jgi:hypothetical protein
VTVRAVEERACYHLDEQALGSPLHPDFTVRNVLDTIAAFQGYPFEGEFEKAFEKAADKICAMFQEVKQEEVAEILDEQIFVQERKNFNVLREQQKQLLMGKKEKSDFIEKLLNEERIQFVNEFGAASEVEVSK